jgi:4-alpha-glucanotransferase
MRARRSGISVPLFSLRSRRSWGIGEIGDIPEFAQWLNAAGQSVLQILPLNELAPDETSPYSPLSAMAIDPQFISVWMIDEGGAIEELFRTEVETVRRSATVDYRRVRALKGRALQTAFARFHADEWLPETEHARHLRAFIEREAWWLEDYSLYRAIRAREGERPWSKWPSGIREGDPQALSAAASELAREILYYQYIQWIADRQWRAAREAAGVEILGDFPFMVTRDSVDVWSRPNDFLTDAQVGTPPDAFSETGQEWGLPPYNWEHARRTDFEWLRLRARRMAELYDGFRIDHLVGFYRTYVRPFDGRPPYFYPGSERDQIDLGETIVGFMTATGADVSAEDLGTVPSFVRESIARLGVPGYKVMRWEPMLPQKYPPVSVAMTSTHDLEPMSAWWDALDPDEQRRFGVAAGPWSPAIHDTLLQLMFDAGSDLLLLPMQDAFGWRDRINLPATTGDGNWTWALPWAVEEFRREPEAIACATRLAKWTDRSGRQTHYKSVLPPTRL